MRQVFRLVGMPDKIIAFDELPADLLKDLEMQNESSMYRHWKEFIGLRERVTEIKPYVDTMTRQLIKCAPLVEKAPFTWVIDWELNSNIEAWSRISAYVRQNVQEGFRLYDKLEDMAKPLAATVSEQITLEPEDVIVIPLKKIEKPQADPTDSTVRLATPEEAGFKCQECGKEFASKQGVVLHRTKKHAEKVPA